MDGFYFFCVMSKCDFVRKCYEGDLAVRIKEKKKYVKFINFLFCFILFFFRKDFATKFVHFDQFLSHNQTEQHFDGTRICHAEIIFVNWMLIIFGKFLYCKNGKCDWKWSFRLSIWWNLRIMIILIYKKTQTKMNNANDFLNLSSLDVLYLIHFVVFFFKIKQFSFNFICVRVAFI